MVLADEGAAMQNSLRVFVALPIPEPVVLFLEQVQAQLQSSAMRIRWLATKNIHLTLTFIGDIDPSRVSVVAGQMDAAARRFPSFSLVARGVGVFPNLRKARVLWVGLAGDLDRLKLLQAGLESSLVSVGFNKASQRFRAHLTIGRTRQRIDVRTIGAALEPLKNIASDSFRVDRLTLFKSILKPTGAEYTPLHTTHLAI